MSTPYRFVTPVPRRTATGTVAAVYTASARELGALFAPHLSPAPDLHAALWAVLREALLAGTAPRARKESVAAAVAVANRCPFCIDAHTAMLHATGEHQLAGAVLRGETPDALVAWARSTRSATPDPWPFTAEHAPEYVGTALANHFINRMVDALRPGSLLPGGALREPSRRAAGFALSRTVRRTFVPGESLALLPPDSGPLPDSGVRPGSDVLRDAGVRPGSGALPGAGVWPDSDVLPGAGVRPGSGVLPGAGARPGFGSRPDLGSRPGFGSAPVWAEVGPVGVAWAAFARAARAGGGLLGDTARAVLHEAVDGWRGEHPELGGWPGTVLEAVPEEERAGARLALLAALAPYRLTESAVAAWRSSVGPRGDEELVRVLAYGAFAAVERLESRVAVASGAGPR